RDVLLADAEEAADPDDYRRALAVVIEQHLFDLTDLVVGGIINTLLVPIGDRPSLGRQAGGGLRRRPGPGGFGSGFGGGGRAPPPARAGLRNRTILSWEPLFIARKRIHLSGERPEPDQSSLADGV